MILLYVCNYPIWGVEVGDDFDAPENDCQLHTDFGIWPESDNYGVVLNWPARKVLDWLDETMPGRWIFGCDYPANVKDLGPDGYDTSSVMAFWHESDAILFKLRWG